VCVLCVDPIDRHTDFLLITFTFSVHARCFDRSKLYREVIFVCRGVHLRVKKCATSYS